MVKKTLSIVLPMVSVLSLFLAGCQEANTTSDTTEEVRRHRLIATENIQLKEQLAQKDAKIADLTDEIAKCEQEKQALQKRADQELQESIEGILGSVMDKNAELQKENDKLKGEIEQLKQSQ